MDYKIERSGTSVYVCIYLKFVAYFNRMTISKRLMQFPTQGGNNANQNFFVSICVKKIQLMTRNLTELQVRE